MATAQSTFNKVPAVAFAGMRANTEPESVISRTVESAAGIAWGQPAFRGSDDHGIVVGAAFAATAAGSAAAGNVGTGTITASPAVTLPVKGGRYQAILLATSATAAYEVFDPNGILVGRGVVGTANTSIPGITTFTISNAGTMTIGDMYYIDVTYGAGSLNLLGIVVFDPAVPALAATPDAVPQNFTASVMTRGVMWVVAGGTVNDGDPVYWKQSNGRYTASSADGIRVSGAYFDTSGVNGDLVRIAMRERLVNAIAV